VNKIHLQFFKWCVTKSIEERMFRKTKIIIAFLWSLWAFINLWRVVKAPINAQYTFHGLATGVTSISSNTSPGSYPVWSFPGIKSCDVLANPANHPVPIAQGLEITQGNETL
jgi:hypothetical protein